ncbi:EAL domain-containing protein [Heliobacillus mobilis]|uniref:EAL domain-containing protein n=1 Tax=Heliobacterium mobile TaxID=28064 RepID=A0A6I3SAA7_HELMO|nr:EAL domain-containing protein [Heliobacterium mobile]
MQSSELTRNVHEDPYKAMVVSKILELCRELGIHSVAEGVESQGEWSWLKERGADFVQGYFFARPAEKPIPRDQISLDFLQTESVG